MISLFLFAKDFLYIVQRKIPKNYFYIRFKNLSLSNFKIIHMLIQNNSIEKKNFTRKKIIH